MDQIILEKWKETLARRYGSLGQEIVDVSLANLVNAYNEFILSQCVDSHFIPELTRNEGNKLAQRLGEMLLHERVKHAGFTLSSSDEGPDFLAQKDGESVWLELVTPSVGDDSRIDELHNNVDLLHPSATASDELRNRTLLRICAGIAAKLGKFEKYMKKGIVKPAERCVIVVNDALMCPDAPFFGVGLCAEQGIGGRSLVEHATLRFGHARWIESDTVGKYTLLPTFRDDAPNRPERENGGEARKAVPVSLFSPPDGNAGREIFERAKIISGVMQLTLREDYGFFMMLRDRAEYEDRIGTHLLDPGTLVCNLHAKNSLSDKLQFDLTRILNLEPLSADDALTLVKRRLDLLIGKR